jgi:opacity protein-like surface antigen
MKKTLLAIVAAASLAGTSAFAADVEKPDGFRFQVGLTFANGISDLKDKIETNNPNISISQGLPGGLSFALYREFGNDWAVGATIGPAVLGVGDASLHIVPIGLDVRYKFVRNEDLDSYIRVGVEKAVAGGDFIESSSAGGSIGLGVEFAKPRGLGWGIEAAYHSSQVKVLATPGHPEVKARPYEYTLGVYFLF